MLIRRSSRWLCGAMVGQKPTPPQSRRLGRHSVTLAQSKDAQSVPDQNLPKPTLSLSPQATPVVSSSTSQSDVASLPYLRHRVESLTEKALATGKTMNEHKDAIGLMRRQQIVLERRIAELEDNATQLLGKLNEAHRILGELTLKQQSAELLMQQMGRKVLLATTDASVQEAKPLASCDEPVRMKDVERVVQQAMTAGLQNRANGESSLPLSEREAKGGQKEHTQCSSSSASSLLPGNALDTLTELCRRMDVMEARMPELTLDKMVMERVLSCSRSSQNVQPKEKQDEFPSLRHAVQAAVVAGVSGDGENLKRDLARLAGVLQHSGCRPFKDVTGATRVSGQCVLVRNIPANIGAAEVREWCVKHIGGVVSCVVRRTPLPPVSLSTSKKETKASYASLDSVKEEVAVTTMVPNKTLAHLKEVPLHTERAFEVVFTSVDLAIQAIMELNHKVMVSRGGGSERRPVHLVVEPVVSADVLAAMRTLKEADDPVQPL